MRFTSMKHTKRKSGNKVNLEKFTTLISYTIIFERLLPTEPIYNVIFQHQCEYSNILIITIKYSYTAGMHGMNIACKVINLI